MSPVVIALGGAIALAGCGSGGPGKLHSGVAAEVGNVAISEAELNHWISLEATFAQKKSGVKVTKPLIIDPPSSNRPGGDQGQEGPQAERAFGEHTEDGMQKPL
jgi:hypothetical protein